MTLERLIEISEWLVADLDRWEGDSPNDERINMFAHIGLLRGRQLDATTHTADILADAKREMNDIKNLLRQIEWIEACQDETECPNCAETQTDGHTNDCHLNKLIT